MQKVYIVVVTYNAKHWLPFFGESLTTLPSGWKVIVIDNASMDATCEVVEKNYPHFTLIKSAQNLGFGRANNIGLSIALKEKAEHVFLLNQDAKISVEHIQRLVAVQRAHPEFFILSPIHLNGDGTDMDFGFASYCLPTTCPHLYADALKGELAEVYENSLGNAAAWLLSRDCLLQIGGFNPLFTHYGEDDEYRNRVLHHGYKLGVVPHTYALHDRANRQPKNPLIYLAPSCLTKLLNHNMSYSFFTLSKVMIKKCIEKLCVLKFDEFFFILKNFLCIMQNKEKIKKIKAITAVKGCHFLSR